MKLLRIFLSLGVAALVGVALLGAPSQADAAFQLIIRATEYNSSGVAENSQSATTTPSSSPFTNTLSVSVGDFNLTSVTNITNTGSGSTAASNTLNVQYTGPTAPSDQLLVEILVSNLTNPPAGPASITANGSPSTSGLAATSLVMTSGVLNSNPTALTAVTNGTTTIGATPLGGQSGMLTLTGSIGTLTSGVLVPNPGLGPNFNISSSFAFYQTYTYSGFTNNGSDSLSSGTMVGAAVTPAPASLLLLLTGLPALGGYGWLRRRKAVQPA